MSAPWDAAPVPSRGDEHADITYAAKGRATSDWEELEVSLSQLYAVLTEMPRLSKEAYQRYGDPLNFKDRLASLEQVAKFYFVRRHDQGLEGEFEKIANEARLYSVRRNEIVHSTVRPVVFDRKFSQTEAIMKWTTTYQFYLVPPVYTDRKFNEEAKPTFIYTSPEIIEYGLAFRNLAWRTDEFTSRLEGRPWGPLILPELPIPG